MGMSVDPYHSHTGYSVKYRDFICNIYCETVINRDTGNSKSFYTLNLNGISINEPCNYLPSKIKALFNKAVKLYKVSLNNPEIALQSKLDNYE